MTTVLNPASVDVEGDVVMTVSDPAVLINNVDLSEDVLTYSDEKTFTAAVTITGDLIVIPVTAAAGDLTVPTDSDIILVNDQDAEQIVVNIADSYSDVIRHDVDDPSIEVSVTGNWLLISHWSQH